MPGLISTTSGSKTPPAQGAPIDVKLVQDKRLGVVPAFARSYLYEHADRLAYYPRPVNTGDYVFGEPIGPRGGLVVF